MMVSIGTDDAPTAEGDVIEQVEEEEYKPRPLASHLESARQYVATIMACDTASRDDVDAVTDACDQISYLAAAESHRCVGDVVDEVLPQAGAFLALTKILHHERTPILLAALATLRVMLQRNVYIRGGDGGLLETLPALMRRLPNKEEVLRDCIALAVVLATVPAIYTDQILEGSIIPLTLSAMQRFSTNIQIQVQGVSLFSALCGQHPEIGELLVQCGNVADFIVRAMTLHPTNSIVCECGARVLATMSEQECNHEALLGTPIVNVLVRALDIHKGTPSVVTNSLVAASALVPVLELTQRHALIARVGKVLRSAERQQPSVLSSCSAFIIVIAQSPNADNELKMFCAKYVVEPLGQIMQETEDEALAAIVEKALRSLAINKFRM
jgi:hypothetical protein